MHSLESKKYKTGKHGKWHVSGIGRIVENLIVEKIEEKRSYSNIEVSE